jgi:signal transduction histidine kinase
MNQQTFNQEIEDSFEEDYDDSKELHDLIDGRLEASIICRDNKKIPNFLSIVYANNLFYLMFDIDENGVIGHNYDFLFSDVDLDNYSEDQAEYARLIKSVRDHQQCSVVLTTSIENIKYSNSKLHITYSPHIVKNEKFTRNYAIFSFIKIENVKKDDSNTLKTRANIVLLRSLERTLRNERTLREIANLIISDVQIDNLARTIAKILCEHLKCDRCLIHDFKSDNTTFVVEYCSSYSKKMISDEYSEKNIQDLQKYINFQNDFYQKFGTKNKKSSISLIRDVFNDENLRGINDICNEYSIASQVAITTTFNGVVNGGIYLHQSTKNSWIEDEINLIEIIAEQFSIALDRSNSIQKVMVANHALMEKTLQLKDSLKQEQEMRKMQNEFVALVSHEFKTPLQIIDGNRELITRKLKNANFEEESVFGYLEKVKSGIQRMNGLINSTLHLAKMENNDGKIKVEPQEINLFKLIEDIIEKNFNLAQQKNIQVHYKINELPTSYLTDPKLLDHAISNIISNAIKYSRNNSHVKIIGKILDDCIAIRVIDTGIGIPAKDLENIGKKFFRAGNSILVAGTGIGIYLTKHFIDLLAGKIIIESKENFGTVVTVILQKNQTQNEDKL